MSTKTYRQISHKLRFHDKDGKEKASQRPREGSREAGWGKYLDSAEKPTLVTIADTDIVDIAMLLNIGAIVEYVPPKVKKDKEGAIG